MGLVTTEARAEQKRRSLPNEAQGIHAKGYSATKAITGILFTTNGDAGGKQPVEQQGTIVKDFKIGKTRIKINDAYCRDKTPADVEAILARIAIRVQEQLTAQEIAKRDNDAK